MLTATVNSIEAARKRLIEEGFSPDDNGIYVKNDNEESLAIIMVAAEGLFIIIYTNRDALNY